MAGMVMTSIYITPAQKRALARRAKEHRTTVSEEIRTALDRHLHENPTPRGSAFDRRTAATGQALRE